MNIIKDYIIKTVNTESIKSGDTILIKNIPTTITNNNIKDDSFIGITIFGKSYIEKNRTVEKVFYPYFYRGEFKGYR